MSAPILLIDAIHPQPRVLERAVAVLAKGELLAYPTDTCFGLGCDLLDRKAIDRLYVLKGRDRKKPLAFLVSDLAEVPQYAKVSNFAYRIMKRLTPGPFTFILEATRAVPEIMQTRQQTIGIRMPDSAVAQGLCRGLGRPIVTTTANSSEGEPLVDAKDIKDELGHGLSLILDGGIQQNEPSTVISLLGDQAEILRQGKGDASPIIGV